MTLQIQQILPTYFDADKTQPSEIWGKNLQFEKGELIKIVAPSGSGKTSLMHFLYGMRHDYTGTINWNSKTTRNLSIEEMAVLERIISVLFSRIFVFFQNKRYSVISISNGN